MILDLKWAKEYMAGGDACVEEHLLGKISKYLNMNEYEKFKFCYYYSTTYNIESALDLFHNPSIEKKNIIFRTDRRWVRIGNRFEKLIQGLNADKYNKLIKCKTTTEAFNLVKSWYYFGRYASFLFCECYMSVAKPNWVDDLKYKWEKDENYTKGALILAKNTNKNNLNEIHYLLKTYGENSFGVETVLCAVEKIQKGTRYDGFYKDRLMKELHNTKYKYILELI